MAEQCERVKPNGARCKARPLPGSTLCYFHSEATAEARGEARRRGGRARSKKARALPEDCPDAPLATVLDVVAFIGQTVNQVRRGQVDAKIGNCCGYLCSVLLRGIEEGELEARLAALENRLDGKEGKDGKTRRAQQ